MASTSRPFAGLQKVNLNGVRFRLIDAKDQVGGSSVGVVQAGPIARAAVGPA